ncbi:hypothetical protein TUM17576_00490 [Enterobacter hormaechei]|nr:hypothetical protein [Enterobacter hormaechei]GJL33229.1 hypothetical protein TUM17576_00490 [Enterobacter hormaechei]
MKKNILLLAVLIPFLASADNADIQIKQKKAQDFYTKISAVMAKTDEARNAYQQGNPKLWKAINSDLEDLVKESDSEFGPAFSTPFQGCFKLGRDAQKLWTDKMTMSTNVSITNREYENAKRECKQNIANPQVKNNDVAIIDLTN